MNYRQVFALRNYALLAVAMFIGCMGWMVFLLPNNIALGGVTGISSILYWGTGIPVQVTYFTINAVLLAFALRVLGLKFCLKTIYAVVFFTVFSTIIGEMTKDTTLLHDQPFMAAIVGATFLGISIGLGLLSGGSTGGSDVIAAMVNKYHDISLGHVILICDLIIITSSYLVLRDWEQVIYGYVVLFVASFCVDRVINTARRSVQFFIISDKHEEIGHAINLEAQRGCTVIDGQGFYTGKPVRILFVLAKQSQSAKIFHIIDQTDPHAFVSQSAVIGVYGQGFDQFKTGRKKRASLKKIKD